MKLTTVLLTCLSFGFAAAFRLPSTRDVAATGPEGSSLKPALIGQGLPNTLAKRAKTQVPKAQEPQPQESQPQDPQTQEPQPQARPPRQPIDWDEKDQATNQFRGNFGELDRLRSPSYWHQHTCRILRGLDCKQGIIRMIRQWGGSYHAKIVGIRPRYRGSSKMHIYADSTIKRVRPGKRDPVGWYKHRAWAKKHPAEAAAELRDGTII